MKALIFALFLVVGCSLASAEPFIVVVRHAEKAPSNGNDPDLSEAGRARAEALAKILKNASISAIFVSEFKRTQETAEPTVKATNVSPTIVPARDFSGLASKLRQLTGNALVVAHGDTIPDIVKTLGINSPIQIPDNDYDELFVVMLGDKPQLLRLQFPGTPNR
jgi:broad specificity phosphatase PhoE